MKTGEAERDETMTISEDEIAEAEWVLRGRVCDTDDYDFDNYGDFRQAMGAWGERQAMECCVDIAARLKAHDLLRALIDAAVASEAK